MEKFFQELIEKNNHGIMIVYIVEYTYVTKLHDDYVEKLEVHNL